MDKSRRSFLKKSGLFTFGLPVLSNPFLVACAGRAGLKPGELAKLITHQCSYIRDKDLLHFNFYFINLSLNGSDCLRKIDRKSNAYILVELPQQHIAEDLVGSHLPTGALHNEIKPSYLSGFSYLTLQIKSNVSNINYTPESLLDWSSYNLITVDDLIKDGKVVPSIELDVNVNYPLNAGILEKQFQNKNKDYYPRALLNKDNVPVTLFEAPYKMYLAPVVPHGPLYGGDNRYQFQSDNSLKQYYKSKYKKGFKSELFEMWNNDLVYKINNSYDGLKFLPPEFKVVAYEEKSESRKTCMLPNPAKNEREKISKLTSIQTEAGGIDPRRNITSSSFNVSSRGVSTYLKYFNLKHEGNVIVGWKQDIEKGRDNYIEVIRLGVEARTGLKVLLLEIGERVIDRGVSYVRHRSKFIYLEKEKSYDVPEKFTRHPFKKIIALQDSGYYQKTKTPGTYYHALREGAADKSLNNLNKYQYIGIDHHDKEIQFEMDAFFVEECAFTPDSPGCKNSGVQICGTMPPVTRKKATLQVIENYLVKTIKENSDLFEVKFNDQQVAFAKSNSLNQVVDTKRTSLPVSSMQFVTKFGTNFNDKHPVTPNLLYTNAYMQQLEGIEPVLQPKLLTYSNDYVENLFDKNINKAQIFLKTASNSVKLASSYNAVEAAFKEKAQPIKDIFTNNYRAIGGMINPDITIEGVSILDQSITLTDSLNDAAHNINQLNPDKILRGLNTEILGGIDLKKILNTVLPLEDSPLFNTISDATDAFNHIEKFKSEYDDIKQKLESTKNDIKHLETQYKNIVLKPKNALIDKELNKFLDKIKTKSRIEMYREEITVGGKKLNWYILKKKEIDTHYKQVSPLLKAKLASSLKPDLGKIERALKNLVQKQYGDFKFQKIKATLTKINSDINNLAKQARAISAVQEEMLDNYLDLYLSSLFSLHITGSKKIAELIYSLKQHAEVETNEINSIIESHITKAENVYSLSEDYFFRESQKLDREIEAVARKIQTLGKKSYEATLNDLNKIIDFGKFNSTIRFFNNSYQELDELNQRAILFKNKYNVNLTKNDLIKTHKDILQQAEESIINKLISDDVARDQLNQIFQSEEIKEQINNYKASIDVAYNNFNYYKNTLDNFERTFDKKLSRIEEGIDRERVKLINAKKKIEQDIIEKREYLKSLENKVKNYASSKINELNDDLKNKYGHLAKALKEGRDTVKEIEKEISEIKSYIHALTQPAKKQVDYTWNTKNFSDVNLGIVRFEKNKGPDTELIVKVKNTIHYDISLNAPPKITKVTASTENSLKNFDLTFLEIITLTFDEASFKGGTDRPEKFDVKIRDVKFNGPLNFVEAIQALISTINKNLILDISAQGARLGYLQRIPDVTGGAFNFAFAQLEFGIYLPFRAGQSMRFTFGLNNPKNKFLISAGIFGGGGCFQIGVEPKRGVTYILLVLEFGGVLYLNLGVANGIVYLFAGIYIRKENDDVRLRGYLTCGGALSLLGIITVSVTLYMGLHGNGDYVEGHCSCVYSIKVGFFKKSVGVTFHRRISGAPASNSSSNESLAFAPDVADEAGGNNKNNTDSKSSCECSLDDYILSYYC